MEYAYRNGDNTWDDRPVADGIRRALTHLPQGAKVLDLGCGNGTMLHSFSDTGWQLFGAELSESGTMYARQMNPGVRIERIVTSVLSIFPDERFDAIYAAEVIEHVFDPRRFVREAAALLKPRGHLVLSTPYHGYLKNLAIAAAGKCDWHYNPLWDNGHIKFWSERTIRELLAECGLREITFRNVGRVPLLWKSMIVTAVNP